VDIFTNPLLEATFTSVWNRIGVGDMKFRGGRVVSCDVMSSLHRLLFRLSGDVKYEGVIFIFMKDDLY